MPTIVLSECLPLRTLYLAENLSRLRIPVSNDKIPAGFPSPAEPYATGYLDFNEFLVTNPAATISVYCGGESMADAGIAKDDLLIIDRSVTPVHRDIVMADLGNEYTLKRLCIKPNGNIELHSENSQVAYPSFQFKEDDQLMIVGVVMHIIKTPRH